MATKRAIFGLAKNQVDANNIIDRLQREGFPTEYVSVLAYDRDNRLTRKTTNGSLEPTSEAFPAWQGVKKTVVGHEKHTKASEGAAAGGTAGGIVGGAVGLLAGLGALAIPGVGPFIAAGPILGALAGSGVGGGVGLLLGGLIGLGLPEYEAKKFESHLKAGKILVSVEAKDADTAKRAKEVLKEEGAEDISEV